MGSVLRAVTSISNGLRSKQCSIGNTDRVAVVNIDLLSVCRDVLLLLRTLAEIFISNESQKERERENMLLSAVSQKGMSKGCHVAVLIAVKSNATYLHSFLLLYLISLHERDHVS